MNPLLLVGVLHKIIIGHVVGRITGRELYGWVVDQDKSGSTIVMKAQKKESGIELEVWTFRIPLRVKVVLQWHLPE